MKPEGHQCRSTPSKASKSSIYQYSEFALNESARRCDNVLRYLEAMIERPSHEPELLRTLTAYVDYGQRRRKTSDALGIQVNTLNYRLTRTAVILGTDLDDVNWLARLSLAIRLRYGPSSINEKRRADDLP